MGPFSTDAHSTVSKSIFDADTSGWDHVFEDFNASSEVLSVSPPAERKATLSRPHQMTSRELSAFNSMFEMIFNAVSDDKQAETTPSGAHGTPPLDSAEFARRLRRSQKVKWTSDTDVELDKKKEEMELCHTDRQLLDWATREVFGESKRFEEDARSIHATPQQPLQPPTYPYLIAILMRTFRDKYADPYLALSIFDHARHLSAVSYVFGCTTHAYNELIETRWRCFRDLRGVCQALEEMRVNGIQMDTRTRALVELVRQQVGERITWEEDAAEDHGELWDIVTRIERLTIPAKHRDRGTRRDKERYLELEAWKNEGA